MTTIIEVPVFTVTEGCTPGTSTVTLYLHVHAPMQPQCKRMTHVTEELKWLPYTGTIFVSALLTEVRNLMLDKVTYCK